MPVTGPDLKTIPKHPEFWQISARFSNWHIICLLFPARDGKYPVKPLKIVNTQELCKLGTFELVMYFQLSRKIERRAGKTNVHPLCCWNFDRTCSGDMSWK